MKRNLLIFSLMFAAIFSMSSCKKNELVTVNGIISGKITDAVTQLGVAGATISLVGTSSTATTASDGTFTISVPQGMRRAIISKTGYATRKGGFEVPASTDVIKGGKSLDYSMIFDASLSPLIGKVKGRISQQALNNLGDEITIAAASANVSIITEDSTYKTITDVDGYYAIDNLPYSNYSYKVIASKGNASGSDDAYYDISGSYSPCNFSISEANITFVSSNVDFADDAARGVAVNTAVVLSFTQNVLLTKTNSSGNVTLKLNDFPNTVVTTSLTASGNKLTIAHSANLQAATHYILTGKVYTSELEYTSLNIDFWTK